MDFLENELSKKGRRAFKYTLFLFRSNRDSSHTHKSMRYDVK